MKRPALILGFLFAVMPGLVTAHGSRVASRHIVLTGLMSGSEIIVPSLPDTGALSRWRAAGTVKPLGRLTAAGSNRGVGFVSSGTPIGSMVMTSSRGTLHLRLRYDQTPGFAPLPVHATYVIVRATGLYAGASGTGSVLRHAGPCQIPSGSRFCTWRVTYRFVAGIGTPSATSTPASTSTRVTSHSGTNAPNTGPYTVIRRLHLGGYPVPAAVDEVDHRVVALDGVRRRVIVLDNRDGHFIARFSLPGDAEPTAAATDPARHEFLIGAATPIHQRAPGPVSMGARLFFFDARNLSLVRAVPIVTHPHPGDLPIAVELDSGSGNVLVVRGDGEVVTLSATTGRILRFAWSGFDANGAALDPLTQRLFITHGGGMVAGLPRAATVVTVTKRGGSRQVELTAQPSSTSTPLPPVGETAQMVGLDAGAGLVTVLARRFVGPQWYVVELDAATGSVVSRYAPPSTGGPMPDPSDVDAQLRRVYIAEPEGAQVTQTRVLALRESDLAPIWAVLVHGPVSAITADIHAHRLFTVDGHDNVATVLDTWSGRLIRTIRLARPSPGTNAASVLISLRTHRAFIGESNGQLTVVNSSLPPLTPSTPAAGSCQAGLTLSLRPGALGVTDMHPAIAPDIPRAPISISVPRYPGAKPVSRLVGEPVPEVPSDPYLQMAVTEYQTSTSEATVMRWFRSAYAACGWRSYLGTMSTNTNVLDTGFQFTAAGDSKLTVWMTFGVSKTGGTYIGYAVQDITYPKRPARSYLHGPFSQVRIALQHNSLQNPNASYASHTTLTNRIEITPLVTAINSIRGYHSVIGLCSGGGASRIGHTWLTFARPNGTAVHAFEVGPGVCGGLAVNGVRWLIDPGRVWNLTLKDAEGTSAKR